MIYANDQWLQMPSRDLYDTQMMQMALNTAKDMYEKGLQEIKEWKNEYGDFMTPIFGDLDKYNAEVLDPVRNIINSIYEAGGDPLRSPEARALISRTINKIDIGKVAKLRQRAENAKEWYKNAADLKSKGLFNEDYINFLGENPEAWADDYAGNTSPTMFTDLNTHTSHWFDDINKDKYIETKDGYDWFGVTDADMDMIMSQHIPDFIASDRGRYELELAKRQLGPNATQEELVNLVEKNIRFINGERIGVERKLNPERELALKHSYDVDMENRRFAHNKLLQDNELKGKQSDINIDIFDEARLKGLRMYRPGTEIENGINTVDSSINIGENGDFIIPKTSFDKLVTNGMLIKESGQPITTENRNRLYNSTDFYGPVDELRFKSNGHLVYGGEEQYKTKDGKVYSMPIYYVQGTISYPKYNNGEPVKDEKGNIQAEYMRDTDGRKVQVLLRVDKTRGVYLDTQARKEVKNTNNYVPKLVE